MSEQPGGRGWWQASDGKWYPPEPWEDPSPPPGWWQAEDGQWYPPDEHPDPRKRPGWWEASDGKWYPPEAHPQFPQRVQVPSTTSGNQTGLRAEFGKWERFKLARTWTSRRELE